MFSSPPFIIKPDVEIEKRNSVCEREREKESVCVCERERERENVRGCEREGNNKKRRKNG